VEATTKFVIAGETPQRAYQAITSLPLRSEVLTDNGEYESGLLGYDAVYTVFSFAGCLTTLSVWRLYIIG
jgi:hypothetical protein